MDAQRLTYLSISEYLELERETDQKYEYHNGSVFALAGGTLEHGTICGNIFGEIRSGLRSLDSNCRAFTSEVKISIPQDNSFVYPDAMVVCGDLETSEQAPNAIKNPTVIVEVLSKSSSNYDRGDKFHKYRQLQSLNEYVIIEQEKPMVDTFERKGDLWKITRYESLDAVLEIKSLGLQIRLSEIYRDVAFS